MLLHNMLDSQTKLLEQNQAYKKIKKEERNAPFMGQQIKRPRGRHGWDLVQHNLSIFLPRYI